MKKMMTKVLSVVFCVAFLSMQMSFADVLQSGMFANKDVLTGAQIKGHTAGLTKIDTNAALNEATLHFNNNTRIDWNKFNVYKDQTLTFKNGNFGVLNNVVGTSISKFAGTIKADSGKIVISNPNGILFEGGKFESLGGLVLTTKDLTSIAVDDTTDFDNLDISNAGYGNDVAIVAITNSSNINAADINIVSQGIYVDSSTLTASDANGIVLTTTDGSTFVASHTMSADDGSVKNITFKNPDARRTQIANSAFTSPNGDIKFVSSNSGAQVDASTINGNLNVRNNALLMNNTNVNGNLDIVSNTYVQLDTVKAGNTTINSNRFTRLFDVNLGKTTIKDTSDNYIVIGGHSTFAGDLDIIAKSIIFGWYETNASLQEGSITVDGNITANAKTDIGYSNTVKANSIDFTTENGSILQANSDAMSGKLIADNITLTANKGFVVGLDANVNNNTSDYADVLACRKSFATDKFAKGNVNLEGGSATVNTKVALLNTNLKNNLDVTANNIQLKNSSVGGNTELKANTGILVENSKLDGTLTANSNGYVQMDTVKAGNTTINSNRFTRLFDVDFGKTSITDTSDNYMVVAGNSTFAGDLDINAKSVIFGWYDTNANLQNGSITVDGNITANAKTDIGYSSTVKANSINFTTENGSILQANSDAISGKLIADNITLTANKGFVVGLDANVNNNTSDYADVLACRKSFATDKFTKGNVNLEGGSATVNTKVALLNTNLKNNLDVTANNIQLKNSSVGGNTELKANTGILVENSKLDGTLTANSNGYVQMDTVKAGDTTINSNRFTRLFDVDLGNTTITDTSDNYIVIAGNSTINGDLTANITAKDDASIVLGWYDTNANLQDGSLTVTGTLTANASGNIGYSNTITANKIDMKSEKGSILQAKSDTVSGKLISDDVTLSAPNGYVTALDANVKNNSSEYFEAMQKTLTRTNFNEVVGKNVEDAGAIDIKSATDNGDLKITIDSSVININADAGNTDLKVTPATVENVVISSTGNLKTGDITIKKSADDTTDSTGNGTFISKNGSVTIDNVKADTDIKITASKDVNGTDLVADAEGNGVGDLIINAGGKADINGGSGKNVGITSVADSIVNNITGADDVTITSKEGTVTGGNLIADGDKDGIGDLIISGKGDVTIDTASGENVTISSTDNNVDVKHITGADDVTINATNGDVKGNDLVADGDKDGVGDLTINAGGKADIDGGSGKNVDIVAGSDVNVKDITGGDDVKIKSDGDVTGSNLKADGDNDKKGDLIIDAKGNVDIDGGSGNNVDIDSGKDTTVKDIEAKDDINIDAGGNVKGDHLIADGDKDGIGDITINAGGRADIDDAHGNTITINSNGGNINNSSGNNGIFYNGIKVNGNNSLTEEVLKNLNNLQQSGINTAMAQSFTPIAFAASDDDEEQSELAKRIAKTVFKTQDGTVTITDRFDTIK